MTEGYSHSTEIAGIENAESAEQALTILRNSENFKDSQKYEGPQFTHSLIEGQWFMKQPGNEQTNKTEERQKEGGEAWEEHQQIIKGLMEKGFYIVLKKSSEVHSGGEIAKASYDEKFHATIYKLNGQEIEITAFEGTQKEFSDKFGKESWFDDMLDYDDSDDATPSSESKTTAYSSADILKNSSNKSMSTEHKQSAWDSFWDNLLKPKQAETQASQHVVQKPELMDIFGFGVAVEQLGLEPHNSGDGAIKHEPVEDIFSLFVPQSPLQLAPEGPPIKDNLLKPENGDLLPETSFFQSIITLELPSVTPVTAPLRQTGPKIAAIETKIVPPTQLDKLVERHEEDKSVTEQPIKLVKEAPVILDKNKDNVSPASPELKIAKVLDNHKDGEYQTRDAALPAYNKKAAIKHAALSTTLSITHKETIKQSGEQKRESSNNIITKPVLQDREKPNTNQQEENYQNQDQDIAIFQESEPDFPLYIENDTAESAKQPANLDLPEQQPALPEAPQIIAIKKEQVVFKKTPLPTIPAKDIQSFNTKPETTPLQGLALETSPVTAVMRKEAQEDENQEQVVVLETRVIENDSDETQEPKASRQKELSKQDAVVSNTELSARVLADPEQSFYGESLMEPEVLTNEVAPQALPEALTDTAELTASVELAQAQLIQNPEASPAPQATQETAAAPVVEMPAEISNAIQRQIQEPALVAEPSNVINLEKTVIYTAPPAKETAILNVPEKQNTDLSKQNSKPSVVLRETQANRQEAYSDEDETVEVNLLNKIAAITGELKTLSEPLSVTIAPILQEAKPMGNKIVEKQLDNAILRQPSIINKAPATKPILQKMDVKPAAAPKHTQRPRLEKSIIKLREEISALSSTITEPQAQQRAEAVKERAVSFKPAKAQQPRAKVATFNMTLEHPKINKIHTIKEITSTQRILQVLTRIQNPEKSQSLPLAVMAENLNHRKISQNHESPATLSHTSGSRKQKQDQLTYKRTKEFTYVNPLTATRQPLQNYNDDINSAQQAISLKMAA